MTDTSDTIAQSIVTRSGADLSLLEKIEALPAKPGVYQFKNADGKVIYIGKAQNLRNRVRQYSKSSVNGVLAILNFKHSSLKHGVPLSLNIP